MDAHHRGEQADQQPAEHVERTADDHAPPRFGDVAQQVVDVVAGSGERAWFLTL